MSVLEALVVLADETTNKQLKSALVGMRVSLESGARFSEAASQHPELFPGYSVEILRSAELTGNLDEVLDQLGDYLDREIETEHKVKSALAYPAVVLVLPSSSRACSSYTCCPSSAASSPRSTPSCPSPPGCSSPWPSGSATGASTPAG
ncbi:MAG: type II secretion system F family protein [Acidimicrobiales bacterium]